jgi:Ca2+-binding RTX toxin-like protein
MKDLYISSIQSTYGIDLDDDIIVGTLRSDIIYGNGTALYIFGMAGDDIIYGSSASEYIFGGFGND